MASSKLTSLLMAMILFSMSFSALAQRYMGFDVGSQNEASVITQLKGENATFKILSYRGEGSLPFIRIEKSSALSQYGLLKEAILMFNQSKVLFGMDVKFYDDGSTFKAFKAALDRDFGKARSKKLPKKEIFTYDDPRDPSSGVQLTVEQAGESKLTSIMYLDKALFATIQNPRKKIDKDSNGKKKGPTNKPF